MDKRALDNRGDHHHGTTTTTRSRARRPARPASATAAPQTTRVAIYVRISTDEEHQPFSLEAQTHRLEAFVPTQPGWVHVETYEDRMSGAKADRPDLTRALHDARLGKFDVLLVYRVDRFARSLKVLVHLLEELEAAGVAFRSATEPIDTSTATGRMLVQLLGVFAEFERATIIDRVINGMERKAARGGWPGGTKPFGLTVGDDNLLATTEDFAVVERIFSRYATGSVGASAVAAELNDDGLRSRNGRRWTPQVVLGILRNRAYLGEVYFRGTWYRSSPEPFVDPEVFDRVQSILDTRGERFDKRFAVRRPEYLLTGLVRCGKCERRYVGISAHGKRHRYRYYICWTRSRYGAAECDAERLRADELEAKVFDALVAVYNDGDLVREAVEAHRSGSNGEAERVRAALTAVESEVRKTEAAIERYMLAFEAGEVSQDRFGKRVRELEDKAAALAERRAELSAAATATFDGFDLSDRALRRIAADLRSAADNAPDQLRKSVAQAFVDGLLVVGRRSVKPTFRVLPGVPTAPDATAAEPGGSAATGVSTKTSGVGLTEQNKNLIAVRGTRARLSNRHAKIRRGGYRGGRSSPAGSVC